MITNIRDNDVKLGNIYDNTYFAGNVKFRDFVADHKKKARRGGGEKATVVRDVIREWRGQPL